MPLPTISIGIEGEQVLRAQIAAMGDAVEDLRAANLECHEVMLKWVRKRFTTRGRHGGTTWPGYEAEPKYRAYKTAVLLHYSGQRRRTPRNRAGGARRRHLPVGRWTLRPAASMPQPGERLLPSFMLATHPEHVWRSMRQGFDFGSAVPYAGDFHRGGRWQRWDKKPTPARRIFVADPGLLRRIIQVYQRHIIEAGGTAMSAAQLRAQLGGRRR